MRHPQGRAAVVAAVLLTLSACATSARREADQKMVARDYAGAAAAYEGLLEEPLIGTGEDRLLLQAATAHALANLGSGRFERSRELLDELIARHPESAQRPAAELLGELLRRLTEQSELLAEARATADGLLAGGRRRGGSEVAATDPAGGEYESLRNSLSGLQRQFERLQSESRAREAELRKLRQEIEALKAIDLQRLDAPPPGPGGRLSPSPHSVR